MTTNGVLQNRTTNKQNELTQVGTTNLAFDNNGDLTTDQNGKTLIYDAWNRVVEQKTGAVSNITFAYDAMNRRIKEGSTVVYFSSAWQAIEERNSSNVTQVQYTWSAAYIDAMIARDRDTDNNGSLEQRVYVMQDANWNITAIANSTGAVVERFQYDAYGKRTVLSPTIVAASDTFVFNHGFAGGKADTVTGRVNFRNREYDVDLMRWTTMDPIGFAAGDMNWYQYVGAGPTGAVDPSGFDGWWTSIFGLGTGLGDPYAQEYAQFYVPELRNPVAEGLNLVGQQLNPLAAGFYDSSLTQLKNRLPVDIIPGDVTYFGDEMVGNPYQQELYDTARRNSDTMYDNLPGRRSSSK